MRVQSAPAHLQRSNSAIAGRAPLAPVVVPIMVVAMVFMVPMPFVVVPAVVVVVVVTVRVVGARTLPSGRLPDARRPNVAPVVPNASSHRPKRNRVPVMAGRTSRSAVAAAALRPICTPKLTCAIAGTAIAAANAAPHAILFNIVLRMKLFVPFRTANAYSCM